MSFKYQNQLCPVCKAKLEENDDIVVCPDCGTPHHRECYKSINRCANFSLHAQGYDYYKEMIKSEKENENEMKNGKSRGTEFQTPPVSFGAGFGSSSSEASELGGNNTADGEHQAAQNAFSGFEQNPFDVRQFKNDKETIDGQSVEDVALTVRSNVVPFIGKFKKMERTKRKLGWNWSAFVFGPYYYFFRKMYKQGILYFCLSLAMSYGGIYFVQKLAPIAYKALADTVNSAYLSGGSVDFSAVTAASDYALATRVYLIIGAVIVLVRILFAVFADYCYKKTVVSIIRDVDEQLADGAAFVQSPMIIPEENLSVNDLRRLYLQKKGGSTIFSPIMAFFVLDLLTSLISKL